MNTKLIREPEERWGLEHGRAKGGPRLAAQPAGVLLTKV